MLTEETVREVFGLPCRVIPDPVSGTPLVVPLGRQPREADPMTPLTSETAHRLPFILDEVEVVRVERLSPSFVRVELGSPALADFGVDGPLWDQRIKLVFPGGSGRLPSFAGADESWYATWLDIPAEERGHMRTYTVRDVVGTGTDTRLVVDLVLHLADGRDRPGVALGGGRPARGPAGGHRARGAAPPSAASSSRRARPSGCCWWATRRPSRPSPRSSSTCPRPRAGTAFLEVPETGDVLDLDAPVGVEVVWLPRDGAPLGERSTQQWWPTSARRPDDPRWCPTRSTRTCGRPRRTPPRGRRSMTPPAPHGDLYAWIAGESGVVTGLRRHLVRGLGIDRRQVAFMGYWRHGVAMRS